MKQYQPVYRHAAYWSGWFQQSLENEALKRSENEIPCVTGDRIGNDIKTGVRCRIGLLDLGGGADRLPRKVGKKKSYDSTQRSSPELRRKLEISHEPRRPLCNAEVWVRRICGVDRERERERERERVTETSFCPITSA
jgi:hypothetical protein